MKLSSFREQRPIEESKAVASETLAVPTIREASLGLKGPVDGLGRYSCSIGSPRKTGVADSFISMESAKHSHRTLQDGRCTGSMALASGKAGTRLVGPVEMAG